MGTAYDPRPCAPWRDGHFVGGHPILDLANTVADRSQPAPDDLLETAADVLSWCRSVGLVGRAPRLRGSAADELATEVRAVREQTWALFDAVARGERPPAAALGALMERAGAGLQAARIRGLDPALGAVQADWAAPGAIPTALSLLAAHAAFTLPAERLRACDRCGWLFLDASRGGRRRWCSMSTCGNREKASRRRTRRPAG